MIWASEPNPPGKTCMYKTPSMSPSVVSWANRTRPSSSGRPLVLVGTTNQALPMLSSMVKLSPFSNSVMNGLPLLMTTWGQSWPRPASGGPSMPIVNQLSCSSSGKRSNRMGLEAQGNWLPLESWYHSVVVNREVGLSMSPKTVVTTSAGPGSVAYRR